MAAHTQQLKGFGAGLPLLPAHEPAFLRKRVPQMDCAVEVYPLRYGLYRHLPVSLRQTAAVHCLPHCWLGCEFSLGTPHTDRSSLLAPFLLLYSRETDLYVRAAAECRSDLAYSLELGRDAALYEWRYRARFYGSAPRLRFELLSRQFGGVCLKAGRTRTDVGFAFRRRWAKGWASLRATMDVNARAAFAPALKASAGGSLAPFVDVRVLLRAGDRPPSLRGELAIDLGRLPVTAALEAGDGLTVWLGARFGGIRLSMPVWLLDWQRLGSGDALFGLAAAVGLAGLLLWARREHRGRLEGLRERHELARQEKLKQEAVLRERGHAEEAAVTILFAVVGSRAVLASAPYPWSPATRLRVAEQVMEVTATCAFYGDEKGIDLPADKNQLLGYLRPFTAEPQELHLLIVYRRKTSSATDSPIQAIYSENERVIISA